MHSATMRSKFCTQVALTLYAISTLFDDNYIRKKNEFEINCVRAGKMPLGPHYRKGLVERCLYDTWLTQYAAHMSE